jgi:hypothetical protein
MAAFGKKARVDKFLQATRDYIVGVDTPEEVRAHTGYRFIIGVTDEMSELGVPSTLACMAAARIHIDLPDNFHNEFEEEFVELIRLWSKSMHVTYITLLSDYADFVVPDMFLSMCDKISVEFTYR